MSLGTEYAALVVGENECFVGTAFQSDEGKIEAIGKHPVLVLPNEVKSTRHFRQIIKKNPAGEYKGKKVWLLSHYENSALTAMIRGMHN